MKPCQYLQKSLELLSQARQVCKLKLTRAAPGHGKASTHTGHALNSTVSDQAKQPSDSKPYTHDDEEEWESQSEDEDEREDGVLMKDIGRDEKFYQNFRPGADPLAFMSKKLQRSGISPLEWLPQVVVLLNDALMLHGGEVGVNGWCFFTSPAGDPDRFKDDTRFMAGPAAFFVPCRPTKQYRDDWINANFETKLQLSSSTLHHDVDDRANAIPIWALGPLTDREFAEGWDSKTLRIPIEGWPSIKHLKNLDCSDPALENETGKPTGVVPGLFKHEGGLRLLCRPANEVYGKAKTSFGKSRALNTNTQRDWIRTQLQQEQDQDEVKKCLLVMKKIAQDGAQTLSYHQARSWVAKAPRRSRLKEMQEMQEMDG